MYTPVTTRVREFESKDAREVCAINKICHSDPQPDYELLEIIDKGNTWVAESDGKVVGFLVSIERKGPYVFNVAVLPDYRGLGIAKSLFKLFEDYYAIMAYGYFYLYVDTNNPAQKLYFDLGYRVSGLKKDFYGSNKHGLVMVKYI